MSALVACFNRTSFYHFHAIDLDGWDRIDFQEYEVKALEEDGYYVEEIGVRTSTAYPFRV